MSSSKLTEKRVVQGVLSDKSLHILYFNARSISQTCPVWHWKPRSSVHYRDMHGYVMALVNQRSPSLDTAVLDVIGTDMWVELAELHCLSLTGWNTRLQCVAKWTGISVHNTNNVNEKVYIGLWYRPPVNSAALDDLYSNFWKFVYQCFF